MLLRGVLQSLSDGMHEQTIWLSVLRQVTSSSVLCPSQPLSVLLNKMGDQWSEYLTGLQYALGELTQRQQVDWTIAKMSKEYDQTKAQVHGRIHQLAEEVRGSTRCIRCV